MRYGCLASLTGQATPEAVAEGLFMGSVAGDTLACGPG